MGHADDLLRHSLFRARREPRLFLSMDGSPVSDAFLRSGRTRATAAVAAPVLDLRASMGLCRRAARHGNRLGRAADLLPPSARRVHDRRAGDGRHHGDGFRRVAASHVRNRHPLSRALLLQRRFLHHHRAERGRRSSPGSPRSGQAVRCSPPPFFSSRALS